MKTVTCHNAKGETKEVPVSELSWRPSVYGVFIKDNAVLLVGQHGDGWDFPGGGIDLGETIEQAFVRETKEETGLNAEIGELLLARDDFFVHPTNHKTFATICLYYGGHVTGDHITHGYVEAETSYAGSAEWIPLEKIASLKFYNPIDSIALIKKAAGI